jgi:hypothetical protein
MSDEKADPMTALKNARLYYAASMINTLSYGTSLSNLIEHNRISYTTTY